MINKKPAFSASWRIRRGEGGDKIVAKKSAPKYSGSHHHEHHTFLIIAAGGFLLMLLVLILFNGNAMFPFMATSPARQETMVPTEKNTAKRTRVVMKNYKFKPETTTIKAGTAITFVNHDEVAHSAVADDGSFSTDLLEFGEKEEVTFDTPGTYTYHCEPHPNMTGTIVVEE